MRVLAFNGSPKMDRGNTALILTPFLEGMKEAGAEVELFHTKKLNINPCLADLSCWIRTPGRCIQEDDMAMLLPRLREAQLWVFAGPVFLDGFTGPLKNLLDRTFALLEPMTEVCGGHTTHPLRPDVVSGLVALVSNSGLWEPDNFDPMVAHMRAICRNLGREYAGALLRPHGPALFAALRSEAGARDILDAAREAGRRLIQEGRIPAGSAATVARQLMPMDEYVEFFNARIRQAMVKATG